MANQPSEPKVKTFTLKDVETQTLMILNNNQRGAFAAVLSMLATERLGYKVTEFTQFALNQDFTEINLSEIAHDVPVAGAKTPETPPTGKKSAVVKAK